MKRIILLIVLLTGCNSFNYYNLNQYPPTVVATPHPEVQSPDPTPKPAVLFTPAPQPTAGAVEKASSITPSNEYKDLCPRKRKVELKRPPPIPFKKIDDAKNAAKGDVKIYQKAVIDILTDHLASMYAVSKYNRDLIDAVDEEYRAKCANYKYKTVLR